MPRIHLIVSEPDRTRYASAARQEGLTLSSWLRSAAADRLDRLATANSFCTEDDLWAFFANLDADVSAGSEPDWEQHLDVIDASRNRGTSGT